MMKKTICTCIAAVLLIILSGSCSKKQEDFMAGGYEFGEIYLYSNDCLVDMNNLEIIVPPEDGYSDLEVVSFGLSRLECLKKSEGITLENSFSVPPEEKDFYDKEDTGNAQIKGFERYKQIIRVKHTANPTQKTRSCTYRIFSNGYNGFAADVTIVQKAHR